DRDREDRHHAIADAESGAHEAGLKLCDALREPAKCHDLFMTLDATRNHERDPIRNAAALLEDEPGDVLCAQLFPFRFSLPRRVDVAASGATSMSDCVGG